MLKTYFSVVIALGFVTILTVTGCKSEEDFRIERANNARLHFEMAQFKELPQDVHLTLPECIRLALENNLDAKVYKLEEAVAREMRTAEVLGMLPEININNNFTGRSNTPASSSKAYKSGGATYGASTSSDRNINAFNIDIFRLRQIANRCFYCIYLAFATIQHPQQNTEIIAKTGPQEVTFIV